MQIRQQNYMYNHLSERKYITTYQYVMRLCIRWANIQSSEWLLLCPKYS